MPPHKLIVNGQDHNLRDSGGVGKYALELHKRLHSEMARELLPNFDIQTIHFSTRSRFTHSLRGMAENVLPPSTFRLARGAFRRLSRRSVVDSVALGSGALGSSENSFLFHDVTNHMTSLGMGRLALSSQWKLLVTFIDLLDLYYPEYFDDYTLTQRRLHYSFFKDRADVFFAISDFTKQTMVERLHIPAEKIVVTPLAADAEVGTEAHSARRVSDSARGRYLIYPAKAWKHKNHEWLFKAMSKRRDTFLKTHTKVLLVGGFSLSDRRHLYARIKEERLQACVDILGFQSDAALKALIRSAEFLIFPSLFEGFGLPILEALQLRCPVLCSTAGSLPEIAGDAAVFFDPRKEDSLVSVFDRMFAGQIDRSDLIRRGLVQARKYSWDKTFQLTAEGYRRCL